MPASEERLRLLDGIARAVVERGYQALTVERLAAASEVDPATFREHFSGRGEAVAAALDATFDGLLESLRPACAAQPQWPLKIKAAVGAALTLVAARPEVGCLLCLDTLSVDAEVASHRLAANERLAALLAGGRRHYPEAEDLPRLTEIALVNAVLALIGLRLAEGDTELGELEPQLVHMLLLPYIGEEEAARLAAA
jgi:AcrR family transcriptional regulator